MRIWNWNFLVCGCGADLKFGSADADADADFKISLFVDADAVRISKFQGLRMRMRCGFQNFRVCGCGADLKKWHFSNTGQYSEVGTSRRGADKVSSFDFAVSENRSNLIFIRSFSQLTISFRTVDYDVKTLKTLELVSFGLLKYKRKLSYQSQALRFRVTGASFFADLFSSSFRFRTTQ